MQFKFIVENSASLPIDPNFWDYLLGSAQKDWEMFVYEQDFLYTQFPATVDKGSAGPLTISFMHN